MFVFTFWQTCIRYKRDTILDIYVSGNGFLDEIIKLRNYPTAICHSFLMLSYFKMWCAVRMSVYVWEVIGYMSCGLEFGRWGESTGP